MVTDKQVRDYIASLPAVDGNGKLDTTVFNTYKTEMDTKLDKKLNKADLDTEVGKLGYIKNLTKGNLTSTDIVVAGNGKLVDGDLTLTLAKPLKDNIGKISTIETNLGDKLDKNLNNIDVEHASEATKTKVKTWLGVNDILSNANLENLNNRMDAEEAATREMTKELSNRAKLDGSNITKEADKKSFREHLNVYSKGEVDAAVAKMGDSYAMLDDSISRSGALSSALASLKVLDYDYEQPNQVMAGLGYYKGQLAYALGLSHYSNDDLLVHGGIAFDSSFGDSLMANVGVSWKFGERTRDRIRSRLEQETIILKQQAQLEAEIEKNKEQEMRIKKLEEQIARLMK